MDLLALALLMATLRDWLAICQRTVPVFYSKVRPQDKSLHNTRQMEQCSRWYTYSKAWSEHACCHHQVGENEAGHAKGQQNWLAGVCRCLVV